MLCGLVFCGGLSCPRLFGAVESRRFYRRLESRLYPQTGMSALRIEGFVFMAKLTIRDLNVRGKRVFLRVDYNVPLEEKDGQMVITDDTRIKETLPTLKMLIERGGKLILTAHLGRPKGQREATMSLRPVAFVDDCFGEKVERPWARSRKATCCCWRTSAITTKRRRTIRRLRKSS